MFRLTLMALIGETAMAQPRILPTRGKMILRKMADASIPMLTTLILVGKEKRSLIKIRIVPYVNATFSG